MLYNFSRLLTKYFHETAFSLDKLLTLFNMTVNSILTRNSGYFDQKCKCHKEEFTCYDGYYNLGADV